MDRKVFLSIFLVIILIFLLDGCSHHKNDPDKTIDQTKIKSQVSKWAQASETGDTNNIKQSMIAENILVVFKGDGASEERVFETVDNFIEFFTKGIWTYQSSVIEVNNISFSNNSAKAHGKWSRIDDYKKYISLMEFDLEKINDNWFISVLHFGKDSEEYMGNEYEDFLEGKHSAYLSFVAGEKKYVFHDHYGGTSITTAYNSDSLIINAYNELTGNGFKKEFDTGSSAVKSSSLSLDENRYHSDSDSINLTDLDMSFADGLVTGRFTGTFTHTDGIETIEIKEGFFYIKHEFNIPEITINSPQPAETVSGEVIVSVMVNDDSDIEYISIELTDGLNIREVSIDKTDNWNFAFDSTEFNDGNCSLVVKAEDIYGNFTSQKINFTIKNN
ncbi:MAG: Ig-like domain-containing protein [Clostridia bacterium]|nr:Ig-like domain-containing protein [Clostridia bacterium]